MALKAVAAPLGSPVGGSGTPDTIPRWATGTTLGNSIMTQDTVNSRIGVSTPAPAARLHTTVTDGTISFGASGTTKGVAFSHNGSETRIVGTDTTLVGSFQRLIVAGSVLGFETNGTSRAMTIDSTGNVGIGTASPGAGLHVVSSTDPAFILASSNAARSYAEFRYNTTTVAGYVGTANGLVSGGSSSDFVVRANAGSLLFLTSGANERMRIDSSGNVHAASGTTTMTDGFFYIPAAAGAPTGAPTAIAGRVPMYYDTTNDQFYIRNGANWRKVTLT
jgi:hypothetical protein